MRLRTVLFTRPAERQLDAILKQSEASLGRAGRERYETLVIQAIEDLLDNPARSGVREIAGRLHYHLRHSRTRVPRDQGRVGAPRHLIVARVIGEDLLVLAFGYDGMVDELSARIQESEES